MWCLIFIGLFLTSKDRILETFHIIMTINLTSLWSLKESLKVFTCERLIIKTPTLSIQIKALFWLRTLSWWVWEKLSKEFSNQHPKSFKSTYWSIQNQQIFLILLTITTIQRSGTFWCVLKLTQGVYRHVVKTLFLRSKREPVRQFDMISQITQTILTMTLCKNLVFILLLNGSFTT